jgi:hypothetical protein
LKFMVHGKRLTVLEDREPFGRLCHLRLEEFDYPTRTD